MNKLLIIITSVVLAGMLWSCGDKKAQEESREAKALLQGTWMDCGIHFSIYYNIYFIHNGVFENLRQLN